MVLVVDESGSMNREHEWLLIMIPLLEQVLVQAGEIQTIAGRLSEFYSIAILYLSLLIHTIASGHFTLPLSLLIHSKVLVLVLGTGTVWLGLEVSESSREDISFWSTESRVSLPPTFPEPGSYQLRTLFFANSPMHCLQGSAPECWTL